VDKRKILVGRPTNLATQVRSRYRKKKEEKKRIQLKEKEEK